MSQLLQELQNTDNLESIEEIQFSLLSHNDIKRGSVVDILTADTYNSNVPVNNGLFDHNMGSIDASIICPIDQKKAEMCPGYFGKIDLALPVFNNHFVEYVEKILKCVCFRCSNLLLDKSDPNVLKELSGKKGINRLTTCVTICGRNKNKKCSYNGGCFILQPTKYIRLSSATSIKEKNNIIQIIGEFGQNALKDNKVMRQQNFTPLICYQILKKIKDEDVEFFGLSVKFSRPEWMIITSLAVPPPAVRPSVRQSDNQRSEDDLTYALSQIVKANNILKNNLNNNSGNNKKIDDYQGYLQYLIALYMDNEIPGVDPLAQRTLRPLKSITQRLKGKEGRLRINIMGKRVDYSARTVISVDPNIDIDEYGVPIKIAMNLTFPEIVTQYNINKMKKMINNGPKNYPGAKSVVKTGDGVSKTISLKHVDIQQVADNLEIGDIVNRHLLDGDVCLFNRQPTLHKPSMMAHRIRVLPFSTFRLNLFVCKPYNADFDGDEMNMHIPQSWQTFTELQKICSVKENIINSGTSRPIITVEQDTLVGAYLLTTQDIKLTKDQVHNIMTFKKNYNGYLPDPAGIDNNNIPYWTGKQLYSLILPDISINQLKNIKIIRGNITDGYLNSESLGDNPGGLIKQIYNAYGMSACNDFLNDTQRLITRWMCDNSFTIGFGDCVISKENRQKVKDLINDYLNQSFDLIKRAQNGAFANNLDDSYKAAKLDVEITNILSKLADTVKDYIISIIPKTNNFYKTGDKGADAKGKSVNMQQIIGCVGQQSIWGKRIEEGFTDRTLPHFSRNDIGPDAKGFCRNSFSEGLSPSETFFSAMGGRTGSIDTAIKSVTGDTPIIIMENNVVKHINIGDWIDDLLNNNIDKINLDTTNDEYRELLELSNDVKIPTTDLDGNVSWGSITHITRHNPSKVMYEIKTQTGRSVKVTDSHSLLIWNNEINQLERKSASVITIGNKVPVTMNMPSCGIDLSEYIDGNTYKTIKERDIAILALNMNNMLVEIIDDNTIIFRPNNLYDVSNDIILDEIIEINKIDISLYPKVYDLTVPSTLNFGLANGLHVVDTADSGYLSRKFIKATEDLMVNYDMTVRNASGNIVQFAYGDDNCDPIKIEKISRVELFEYDNRKMVEQYKFDTLDDKSYFETFMTPNAVKEMMEDPNYKTLLNDEFDEIFAMRNIMRNYYFKNAEAIGDINTFIPINLYRVIPSQLINFNIQPYDLSDITPQYIINTFKETMKDIVKYLPEKEENWKLYKIIFKSFLSTKRVLKEYRMSKGVFDSIILMIKDKMFSSLVNAGEMIGIIGAQTLGEISTQLTLNSVTYETEIIVRDVNKKIRKYQIGDFIEREIKNSEKIDYMEDKDTTYAECKEYFEIPSCDIDGNVTWERIEAVTRHPVINKDGSNTMLKFTTEDEREVIVTKAKSLLKLVNGKIIEVDADTFKVGDYLPVSTKQIDFEETFELDLKEILPPNEYVYGTELAKAKSVMKEHHWWLKHANKTFTLPLKRNSTILLFKDNSGTKRRSYMNEVFKDGYVFCKHISTHIYYIPETIKLDYHFGYLIGAYLSEGSLTEHTVSIANIDDDYLEPIKELCNKWNLNYYVNERNGRNNTNHRSKELNIQGKVLRDLIMKLCGKLSHNKFVSDKIIYSNKQCLRGLLDAYIGGDGNISTSYNISMCTTSKKLLVDIQNILLNFGIFSSVYLPKIVKNKKIAYVIYIYGRQSHKLAQILDMKIGYKKDAVKEVLKHKHMFEYAKKYELVPNEIDGEIVMEEKDGRLIDVVFDKIKSIEEVPNTTNYAFDLTVENTRNFIVYSSIILNDTFHMAGVGAGSLVITESIPRLREIINVTKSKNMKVRSMKIYLKPEYAVDKNEAKKIQSKFGYTQLKDIISKSEILYDNKMGDTDISEDREFIKSYKEFAELFEIDNIDNTTMSPWVLRLTFDKESLMNKKITIQDIQETIKYNFHNDQEIDCIYSDDSANDVIMRIQIKHDSKGNFLEFLKEFEKQLIELSLFGISNINSVYLEETNIIKYGPNGDVIPSKEWMLLTDGSNILDIMAEESVDIIRTYTNDIIEFFEIFGIEATRELIYREMSQVYSSKHPNPRHIQMMSDIMTYRGKLMPIDRHGLNNNPETGPIAKACFEEVMNNFIKAAVFAEKDNMKGVSANILAGQFCKSGTNAFELLIDEDKLLEKIDVPDYIDSDYVNINETDVNKVFNDIYNKKTEQDKVNDSDFTFGFGMEQIKPFNLDENIKTTDSNLVLVNKDKVIVENNLSNININITQNYTKVNNNNKDNNKQETVNFEDIDIEEPTYNNKKENNTVTNNITVTEEKETDNTITEEKTTNNTVTEEKITDNTVTEEKATNNTINFESINIEEPEYTENKPVDNKPKKIRIKKTVETNKKPTKTTKK